MAQTGFTPISLYYTTTASAAPTASNLVAGELAINTTDGKLYYKDTAGVVQVIAGKGGAGVAGGSNTQVQYNSSGSLAGSSNMTFDGSTLTTLNSAYTGTLTGGTGVVNLGSGQFYKDASGNVGIGTSSPSRQLAIQAATGVSAGVRFGNTAQAWDIETGTTDVSLRFVSAAQGAERMRIDSSGNLLVGTTSNTSSSKFAVNGRVGFYDVAGNQNAVSFVPNKGVGATNSGGFGLAFNTVNFTPSSLPNALYWDGNTGYLTILTSSEQFKRNITLVTDSQLDKAFQLKPSYYQRLEYDYWEYGFIAEQAKEVGLDELVTYHDGKVTGFDYNKVGVFAIGLIQRQQKQIDDLTTRLTALENK